MKKIMFFILIFLMAMYVWANEFRGGPKRGADDGDETYEFMVDGSVDTANADDCIEIMRKSVDRWGGAMRFPDVTIPQGATINSAYIKFVSVSSFKRACDSIACENVDDATVLIGGTGNNNISNRWANVTSKIFRSEMMTYTSVTPDSTPDLKTIVQEIVDRPGWESGNAVMFLFKTKLDGTGGDACTSYSEPQPFEGIPDGRAAESLLVDYTVSATTRACTTSTKVCPP